MASTLFFVSGVWAFWRIKKFSYGLATYALCFILYMIGTGMSLNDAKLDKPDLSIAFIALGILILSFILPIILIRKWSIEWNKNLQSHSPINI